MHKMVTFAAIVLAVGVALIAPSCSPRMHPSGTEANLLGRESRGRLSEQQRLRQAESLKLQKNRLNRGAERTQRRREEKQQKEIARARKRHFEQQHPDVQARMKQSQKHTKRHNRSDKSFIERLFNNKKKCTNGL